MMKFFRKVRKSLLPAGKTGKFLQYAIGEIVLVVIGILIALQINNWNENRKDNQLVRNYLEGIKSDLEKDIIQVDDILNDHINAISILTSIDSSILKKEFHQPDKYQYFFNQLDTTKFAYVFYRGYSFRPTNGAFHSLISDGKSGLIKNKSLFQNIQEIYMELNPRLASNYESLKRMEETIRWNYPKEKEYWSYSELKKAKNEKIFLDLANFIEERYFYAISLFQLKMKMAIVIKLLENEALEK